MSSNAHARVIVAMVTPFDSSGDVDCSAAVRLSRHLVDHGADGILVSGTTGESPALTDREKLGLLDAVLKAVGDRAEVWMGAGTNDTQATVALSREGANRGAHGIMLVTPYYNKPTQEGMYQHFRAAAEACELPVMLYNVPGRTGINLESDTVVRLAQLENVVALKEASGDLDQVGRIRRSAPEDFLIYSGDDSLTLPIMSVGGWGVVSVAAHLVADEIGDMIDFYLQGDIHRASQLHLWMLPLFEAMTIQTNPIPVKTAVNLIGADVGGFRPPLVDMEGTPLEELRKVLTSMNLINE